MSAKKKQKPNILENISFTKMVATGNDFIVINNIRKTFPDNDKALIQDLCKFHTGIGADGILLLESSSIADFKMRIFNPDGSEPEMCGNGARCIGHYAWKNKITAKKFTMETLAGILKGEILPLDNVKIFLSTPKNIELGIREKIDGKVLEIHSINTGVPHAIIYVKDIDDVNVDDIGRKVRYLKRFSPKGTNVNFVQVKNLSNILVRTYERGVEQETLACGTGVTASAITSAMVHKLSPRIQAKTKSGETLIINTEEVSLTGSVRIVFKGTADIK